MAYVYELIDTVTKKWYVGSRTSPECQPEELGVSYFTSSKVVSNLFRDDPGRFEKRILVQGDSDYIARTEVSILQFRDAMKSISSFNMTNGNANYSSHKVGVMMAHSRLGVCGRTKEQMTLDGRKGAATSLARGVGIFAPGMAKKASLAAGGRGGKIGGAISGKAQALAGIGIHTPEIRSKAGKLGGSVTGLLRYRCLTCGEVSSPGPLSIHQKAKGHTGKERIEVQNAA